MKKNSVKEFIKDRIKCAFSITVEDWADEQVIEEFDKEIDKIFEHVAVGLHKGWEIPELKKRQ